MSRHDYAVSKEIASQGFPFYALIMAAMRQADTDNAVKLRTAFPEAWEELNARYNAPGGILEGEDGTGPVIAWTVPTANDIPYADD